MIRGLSVAVRVLLVHTQRQAGDGLGDHAHTSVDRGELDCALSCDGFTCAAGPKEKGRRWADAVPGLVPCPEKGSERVFHKYLSFNICYCRDYIQYVELINEYSSHWRCHMKRFIALLIVVFLFLSSVVAFGENSGYENLTLDELQAILDDVQAEIKRRSSSETESGAVAIQLGDQHYTVEELIDMCSAINHELLTRAEFESFDVPVGTWTVGKHMKAGLYSIVPQNTNDSVYCDVSLSQLNGNKVSVSGEVESGFIHHLLLSDGDTIEIKYHGVTFSSGSPYPTYEASDYSKSVISFTNYSDKELKETYSAITKLLSGTSVPTIILECGIWIVGEDIPAGTYDIEAFVNEKRGNYSFLIYDDSKMLSLNRSDFAMFGYGKSHETNASNIVLVDGNIILTQGCMATLTVSDTSVFFGPN